MTPDFDEENPPLRDGAIIRANNTVMGAYSTPDIVKGNLYIAGYSYGGPKPVPSLWVTNEHGTKSVYPYSLFERANIK